MEDKIIREPFDNDIDEYCSICGDDTIWKVIDGDKQTNGYSCSKVCFCQSCFALLIEEIKDYEKMEDFKISTIKADGSIYEECDLINVCGEDFNVLGHTKTGDLEVVPHKQWEGSKYQLDFLKKMVAENKESFDKLCNEYEELESKYNKMVENYDT